MKLQTQIPLTKAGNQIDYTSQLLLLGSCFSENIGAKLKYFKFQTLQNPFGILFHPYAIGNLVTRAIEKEYYREEELFFLNERWHCFDAHSSLSEVSKEKLVENLNAQLVHTEECLSKATHISITLGTAWVYRKKETGKTVANCHKVPQKEFDKRLLTVAEVATSLQRTVSQIQNINKKAQLIVTISPVRHLKDGFVENQRSKSHLITAVHQLLEVSCFRVKGFYFPAYELIMDELRDYRFYERDMVHPNQLAIDYVWEKFAGVWISDDIKETMKKIEEVQKGAQHRPFDPNSVVYQKFHNSLQQKIDDIKKAFPFMEFSL
ncbi:GSCFA domain-containing protein [Maribacter antarcticus]|uniref:GSCFA domain-containing protein n=1 Tax=Maribacter antarcticus TaxID=505250 RepID=UPI00047E63B6|nr:GSCFA domain-containing protein [Maribacter antarcticus]